MFLDSVGQEFRAQGDACLHCTVSGAAGGKTHGWAWLALEAVAASPLSCLVSSQEDPKTRADGQSPSVASLCGVPAPSYQQSVPVGPSLAGVLSTPATR